MHFHLSFKTAGIETQKSVQRVRDDDSFGSKRDQRAGARSQRQAASTGGMLVRTLFAP
jgi:hypothetical protein